MYFLTSRAVWHLHKRTKWSAPSPSTFACHRSWRWLPAVLMEQDATTHCGLLMLAAMTPTSSHWSLMILRRHSNNAILPFVLLYIFQDWCSGVVELWWRLSLQSLWVSNHNLTTQKLARIRIGRQIEVSLWWTGYDGHIIFTPSQPPNTPKVKCPSYDLGWTPCKLLSALVRLP